MEQRGLRQRKESGEDAPPATNVPATPRLLQNAIGPAVRRLRYEHELTQDTLAARCGVAGCDLSRGTLAKIEAQVRPVSDAELFTLAQVLKVPMDKLFPADFARQLKRGVAAYRKRVRLQKAE